MMHVQDVMTIEVITVTPEHSLKEAARLMVDNGISGIPVVEGESVVVGIITEADFLVRDPGPRPRLLSVFFDEGVSAPSEAVGDVMTRHPVVVFEDTTLSEAGRTMANKNVKRLPVVDADGHLVGIISRSDIVRAFARPDDVIEDEIRQDVLNRILMFDPDLIEVREGRCSSLAGVDPQT
jgi:CBS domain-containing protein